MCAESVSCRLVQGSGYHGCLVQDASGIPVSTSGGNRRGFPHLLARWISPIPPTANIPYLYPPLPVWSNPGHNQGGTPGSCVWRALGFLATTHLRTCGGGVEADGTRDRNVRDHRQEYEPDRHENHRTAEGQSGLARRVQTLQVLE